jgi:hypothetical protein
MMITARFVGGPAGGSTSTYSNILAPRTLTIMTPKQIDWSFLDQEPPLSTPAFETERHEYILVAEIFPHDPGTIYSQYVYIWRQDPVLSKLILEDMTRALHPRLGYYNQADILVKLGWHWAMSRPWFEALKGLLNLPESVDTENLQVLGLPVETREMGNNSGYPRLWQTDITGLDKE